MEQVVGLRSGMHTEMCGTDFDDVSLRTGEPLLVRLYGVHGVRVHGSGAPEGSIRPATGNARGTPVDAYDANPSPSGLLQESEHSSTSDAHLLVIPNRESPQI
ncbi:hypothetical protein [Streptomyces tendae]